MKDPEEKEERMPVPKAKKGTLFVVMDGRKVSAYLSGKALKVKKFKLSIT